MANFVQVVSYFVQVFSYFVQVVSYFVQVVSYFVQVVLYFVKDVAYFVENITYTCFMTWSTLGRGLLWRGYDPKPARAEADLLQLPRGRVQEDPLTQVSASLRF